MLVEQLQIPLVLLMSMETMAQIVLLAVLPLTEVEEVVLKVVIRQEVIQAMEGKTAEMVVVEEVLVVSQEQVDFLLVKLHLDRETMEVYVQPTYLLEMVIRLEEVVLVQ